MSDKPPFRSAERLTEEAALDAFSSASNERVRSALLDASRCLDDDWVFPHAMRFVAHPDGGIRWAALFALDMIRSTVVERLRRGEFDESADEAHPIRLLAQLAVHDPAPDVRAIAVSTMADIISALR